jgi:5'-nucleotidase (lipoprotein e(P4) family)
MKRFISFLFVLGPVISRAQHTIPETEIKIYPILWQQQAAEYRALCYQAFNIAALRLNAIAKKKSANKKLAIITDLDETILDNSYQEAELIKTNKQYSDKSWLEWSDKSAATAVPGAVEFLQMAKQKGVTVFYISNRDTGEVNSTLINLKKLKLPNADVDHMLFLSNTSSKETRRQTVMSKYNVVMLLGDNLNDFMQAFEKRPIDERKAEVDEVRDEWGKKFIVLPNAAYGEWENAIYDYERKLTPEQKETKRKEKLKDYSVIQ